MEPTPEASILGIKHELRPVAISAGLFLAHQVMEGIFLLWFAPNGYSDLCQLDCKRYADIASNGYERLQLSEFDYSRTANLAFFPLLPIAASLVSRLLDLSPQTATILTAKAFFFLSIYAFIRLAQTIIPSAHPLAVGSIAAFNPYSIYGNAGYTEPLFLFLTCTLFALLERRMFLVAGLAGGLLSASRFVGIVSMVSHLISWAQHWPSWRWGPRIRAIAGMVLIAAGLLFFMAHLYERTGDPLAFIHIQKAWGRSAPTGPASWMFALGNGLSSNWWLYRYWAASGIVVLIISLTFILRRRYVSLASFSLLSTLIPLSSDCWGLSRYIWWQAPVLLFVAYCFVRNRALLAGWLTFAILVNAWCYRLWFTDINWHIS